MMTTTDQINIVCFDCGLAFTVMTDNPEVIQIFAEKGCLSPQCRAVHALLVSDRPDIDEVLD